MIGFFCVGSPAQVPNDKYTYSQDFIDVGLGMKPELTGQGMGLYFSQQSLTILMRDSRKTKAADSGEVQR